MFGSTLLLILSTTGCSLFENIVNDAIPPIDIEVDMIDQGVTEPGANVLDDLTLSPSVDNANPTWASTAGAAEDWGGALLIDSMSRAGGGPGVVGMTVGDLVVMNDTGDPFTLDVALGGGPTYSTETGGGPRSPTARVQHHGRPEQRRSGGACR